MRTIIGGSPVDVVWYRAEPGASMYTHPTVFRSRQWVDPHKNTGIGEQSEGDICCGRQWVDWYNGRPPAALVAGDHTCGTDLVAETGAGPGDPTFVTGPDGAAPCCLTQGSWLSGIAGNHNVFGFWQSRGPYPPSGVLVSWEDDDGHTGSNVSAGSFTTYPYPYYGFTSFDLLFTPSVNPTNVRIIFFASVSSEAIYAWGDGYLQIAINTIPPGFLRIFTFRW